MDRDEQFALYSLQSSSPSNSTENRSNSFSSNPSFVNTSSTPSNSITASTSINNSNFHPAFSESLYNTSHLINNSNNNSISQRYLSLPVNNVVVANENIHPNTSLYSNSHSTSNTTTEDAEEIIYTSNTPPQHRNLQHPRPQNYPKIIQDQLRSVLHHHLSTFVNIFICMENSEKTKKEAKQLLTVLHHQHLYLVPSSLLEETSNSSNTSSSIHEFKDTSSLHFGSLGTIAAASNSTIISPIYSPSTSPTLLSSPSTTSSTSSPNSLFSHLSPFISTQLVVTDPSYREPEHFLPKPPQSNDELLQGVKIDLTVYDYTDNSRYEGEMDQSRIRQGLGSYYYQSGTVYRGQWFQGNRHGIGCCEFMSGNKYVGFWNLGRREGRGIFIFTKPRKRSNDVPFPRLWNIQPNMPNIFKFENLYHFQHFQEMKLLESYVQHATSSLQEDCLKFYTEGSTIPLLVSKSQSLNLQFEQFLTTGEDKERYEGEFYHDLRQGFGIYYFPDGSCYAGMWKNNRRYGRGIYYFPSGRYYDGEWSHSTRHGFGIMRDVDGHILYIGHWSNDKKEGMGTQYDNGDWITAVWSQNRIQELVTVQLHSIKQKLKQFLFCPQATTSSDYYQQQHHQPRITIATADVEEEEMSSSLEEEVEESTFVEDISTTKQQQVACQTAHGCDEEPQDSSVEKPQRSQHHSNALHNSCTSSKPSHQKHAWNFFRDVTIFVYSSSSNYFY